MFSPTLLPFPQIATPRLVLCQLTAEDTPEIFFMRSDPDMMQHVKRPLHQSHEESLAFINMINNNVDENRGLTWGITLHGGQKIIGTIAIWRFDNENYRGEVGYQLMPQWQGKGYMSEAMHHVIAYAHNTLKLHTLVGHTDPDNHASHKVLLQNGFRQEGHTRQDYLFEGVFCDTISFGLVLPEWASSGTKFAAQ